MFVRDLILPTLKKALLRLGAPPASPGRLLLACSGGADSMALLHLLQALKEGTGSEDWLRVAHLDHGLRGSDSQKDSAFVREWCGKLNLACDCEALEPGRLETMGQSLEEAAREIRYAFLAEVAQSHGCHWVVTAHTRDDAAETFLLRLLRGSGRTGLCGLQEERVLDGETRLIRPALEVPRALLHRFLAEENLPFREDATNRDPRFDRNRLRAEVMPVLETFSPGIGDRLAWTSQLLTEEEAHLCGETKELADQIVISKERKSLLLDRKKLLSLSRAFRYRVLREALLRSRGGLRGLSRTHIQGLDALLQEGQGAIDLPGGWRGEIHQESLQLARLDPTEGSDSGFCYEFTVPGRLDTVSGYRLAATYETVVPSRETIHRFAPRVAWLDAAQLGSDLKIRSWRPGDRVQPLGMAGKSRKVQDLLTDLKVPGQERGGIPILEASGQIAWVSGLTVAEPYRIRSETRRAVRIEMERIP